MPLTVDLTGEAEVTTGGVPNQGDLDGTGTATVRINPGLDISGRRPGPGPIVVNVDAVRAGIQDDRQRQFSADLGVDYTLDPTAPVGTGLYLEGTCVPV